MSFSGGPSHHQSAIQPSTEVTEQTSTLTNSLETSSSSANSPTAAKPRPKGPPPPLPKTPPSTAPKAVQKAPSMNRTPPPIPRTPPRGSIKAASSNTSISSPQNSQEKDLSSSQENAVDNTHEVNTADAPTDNSATDKHSCDNEITSSDNACESKTAFSNIKSRFGSSKKDSSGPPKVSQKPKAKPSVKKKDINGDFYADNNNKETDGKGGNSNWFIDTDTTDTTEKTDTTETEKKTVSDDNDSKNSEIQFVKGKLESSIKYKKAHSPNVPRKPPPKPPAKTNKLSKSTENVSKEKDDTSSKTLPSDKVLEQDNKTNSNNDLSKSDENIAENVVIKVSPKVPTPVPRKPAPVARPRPTPRKKLSLTTGAGIEIVESEKGSNLDLSVTHDKHAADNDGQVKDETGSGKAESVKKEADSEAVTRRIVTTATGEEEEYKVIDRSSVRSGSHITEIEHDDDNNDSDGVILRKKVVRDDTFDIQDVPSIEELKSIFNDTDEEPEGEDLLPSGDFGFGDKFLTFSKDKKETKPESVSNTSSSVKTSDEIKTGTNMEDMMQDDLLLEPSSLLNEIEDILLRSFKHSSLTRSGSSPEKQTSPYIKVPESFRSERSKSVDHSESSPVRPPRPKKEQKRLRSVSQISHDSCGSDTESLPDMCRGRLDSQSSNISMTLGTARPHPPKPKRKKLLTVQRSQSDVTVMRSVVEKLDTSVKRPPRFNPFNKENTDDTSFEGCDINKDQANPGTDIKNNIRNHRPTRKAPPPPQKVPLKTTQRSPSMDINCVVPVDERVKSMNLSKQRVSGTNAKRDSKRLSGGPYYHSIKDEEAVSSDGDHDYQDIPDMSRQGHNKHSKSRAMSSPPKLPPRNLSNSQSFDTSSLSSAGHELSLEGSVEDMSISSAGFDTDIHSPGPKHHSLQVYPKTSSPFVKGSGDKLAQSSNKLGPSSLSLSSSGGEKSLRPVSSCSVASDCWSESQGQGHTSSSESEPEDEEKVTVTYILTLELMELPLFYKVMIIHKLLK